VLIDWFTVSAQIVNFLILVYLLKRFLYQPILRAMDEREKKIAGRLREAEEKREKADSEAEEFAELRRELAENRKKLESETRKEIEQWRDEAMAKVRDEVEEMRQSWQESLAGEQEDFRRRLKTTLSRQVFLTAARALRDLADERLEWKLVETFNRRLPEAIAKAEASAEQLGKRLRFVTGFRLSEEQEKEVRNTVTKSLPETEIGFEVDHGLGFGVRLSGQNRKIEWGLDRYMTEMEKRIMAAMQLEQEQRG